MIFQGSFLPGDVLDAMDRATMMMGVPTYYTRLLAEDGLTRDKAANMRLCISGSAPLLAETFDQFEQRTGHKILERYGMTETGMNASNPLDGDRRPGTVGPALPGVEARIADENGTILKAGDIGVLEVRGKNVFQGYWQMPEKTAEEFRDDGFFITGDLATIDEDGYITIVGRNKDLIITGGLNVYPKEIEAVIDDMAGVGESAVIGVPHPDFGEGVIAVVAGSDGNLSQEQVIAHAKTQLASFKVPKHVFFIEALPRNSMGKVQKNILRKAHEALFAG
jgi:malonyl-CoA/methylmalonyl-CoA synthetase